MSIIVVNLEDNRAVFRIFIALLRFSFDSPSYITTLHSKNPNYTSFTSLLTHKFTHTSCYYCWFINQNYGNGMASYGKNTYEV